MLTKSSWTYKDIMSYLDVGKTKAYEIMKMVKRYYNGAIPNLTEYVKRDSVLNYLGTDIERETYIERRVRDFETLQEREV